MLDTIHSGVRVLHASRAQHFFLFDKWEKEKISKNQHYVERVHNLRPSTEKARTPGLNFKSVKQETLTISRRNHKGT
jgi:hypothetical protein